MANQLPVRSMNERKPRHRIVSVWRAILPIMAVFLLLYSVSASQNNSLFADPDPASTSATVVSGSSEPSRTSADGSNPGIGLFGNRHIDCNRHGNRYTGETSDIGRSYAQQVEATSKLITDSTVYEYVNGIARNLARNSDIQIPLTIKIIDSKNVNAFSLPTRFIFVYSGLILAADNEAELAAVIAHEIAHLAACHAAHEVAREDLTNVGSLPLIFRLAIRPIAINTINVTPTHYFESEADFLALGYLHKAGYDPQGLSSILEKVKAIAKEKAGNQANVFESSSLIGDRIKRTRKTINTSMAPAREYKVDTSAFKQMKEKLSELDNCRQAEKKHS